MTGTKMMLDATSQKFAHTEMGDAAWDKAWAAYKVGEWDEGHRLMTVAGGHYRKAGMMSMVYEIESLTAQGVLRRI